MPAYNKGNVIRGGFGSTFKRLVCHASCRDPEICDLRQVCPYTAVFHPFVPADSEKIRLNRDIPRPFVIKPPLEARETYLPGEKLSFDFVVLGKAKEYLPYFIVTFKELSRAGLGQGRTAVELDAVWHIGLDSSKYSVFSGDGNLVQPPKKAIAWRDLPGVPGARRVTLRFLTATMLKANGVTVRKPAFGPLAKRLRDRISSLAYFYCGQELDIDFRAFGEKADKIKTLADSTRWVESARYSKRRAVTQDLSGFVGDVTFEGDLEPFLPYLKLGEYLHVGKNAVFGNGWYEIAHIG